MVFGVNSDLAYNDKIQLDILRAKPLKWKIPYIVKQEKIVDFEFVKQRIVERVFDLL